MWYMQAFQLLARDRQSGMSAGQIPMASIILYMGKFDLIGTEEEFIAVITKMDDIALERASKEREVKRVANAPIKRR